MNIEPELVTVIICNYNYADFVGEAIASALAIDWPNVEVIVIDDGSTDSSQRVIEKYVPLGVRAIFGSKQGQTASAERAYNESHGAWILFLDADDTVHPAIVREAVGVMKPGWSMIQFQMSTIDEAGRSLGTVFPKYRSDVTPDLIRYWVSHTDSYPTPPNSGNFLARDFLEKIFPLEKGMDRATDSYFLSTAPILGDVLTVRKPLASYRIHGRNLGAQSTTLSLKKVATDLQRHITRCNYATRLAAKFGVVLAADRWRYGFYNLAMRLTSLRLDPSRHPIPNDTIAKCLRDAVLALITPQGLTLFRHIGIFIWLVAVASFPEPLARRIVSWRFVPSSRPDLLRRLMQAA
ncbi:glycosyltransferase family 2 protein [Bradyrhizobium frederickii]|uniref:Glycosyltransferase family 2 protein n=1 Tax=Bradyrhizobium frederickii TaxID=2560054 RepID=A0A4Y9P0L0_9BRAD|nr:glycosyltransferase family 2 protein [Bradyrhizobium frederickii]TFV73714.1 glycosyltransferase family 2 protein [Bradyrhizobium frederickii]